MSRWKALVPGDNKGLGIGDWGLEGTRSLDFIVHPSSFILAPAPGPWPLAPGPRPLGSPPGRVENAGAAGYDRQDDRRAWRLAARLRDRAARQAVIMSTANDPDRAVIQYFVDEAGNPTLFDARGKILVAPRAARPTSCSGKSIDPGSAQKIADGYRVAGTRPCGHTAWSRLLSTGYYNYTTLRLSRRQDRRKVVASSRWNGPTPPSARMGSWRRLGGSLPGRAGDSGGVAETVGTPGI